MCRDELLTNNLFARNQIRTFRAVMTTPCPVKLCTAPLHQHKLILVYYQLVYYRFK